MPRTTPQAAPIELELPLDDADVLCHVVGEHHRIAQADDGARDYLDLVAKIRDHLVAALAAAGSRDRTVRLTLAPVEAVCVLLLIEDLMAQYPDCPPDEPCFNVDRALRLSHEMVTVESLQLM